MHVVLRQVLSARPGGGPQPWVFFKECHFLSVPVEGALQAAGPPWLGVDAVSVQAPVTSTSSLDVWLIPQGHFMTFLSF